MAKKKREDKYKKYYSKGKCPGGDDCFNCKYPDCEASSTFAYRVNVLQGDRDRADEAKGNRRNKNERS